MRLSKSSTATRFREITLYLKLTTEYVPPIKTSTRHRLPRWHLRPPIPHPARWILDLTSNTHCRPEPLDYVHKWSTTPSRRPSLSSVRTPAPPLLAMSIEIQVRANTLRPTAALGNSTFSLWDCETGRTKICHYERYHRSNALHGPDLSNMYVVFSITLHLTMLYISLSLAV